MKRSLRLTALTLGLILISGLTISVQAQCNENSECSSCHNGWLRMGLPGGGTVFDLELLDSDPDVAWAVCSNNGMYRSTWNGSTWGTWSEQLTGAYVTGAEVISANGAEHVLGSTGNWGLWYKNGASNWARPNGQLYPDDEGDDWRSVAIHDAAFWADPITFNYPEFPEQQFYCILNGETDGNLSGLYYWDNDPQALEFARLDLPDTEAHSYDHFYRDLTDNNRLWVVRKAEWRGETLTDRGILYVLSGDYGATPVPVNFTSNLIDVHGLSHWHQGNDNFLYILAEWGIDENNPTFSVFKYNPNGDPPPVEIYRLDSDLTPMMDHTDEEIYKSDDYPFRGLVGKPHYTSGTLDYHTLWLAASELGVWYVETGSTPNSTRYQGQVNMGNGTSPLLRWTPRLMMRDWLHTPGFGDQNVNILLGTHQAGVWYLRFPNLNTYTWEHLDEGFFAEN